MLVGSIKAARFRGLFYPLLVLVLLALLLGTMPAQSVKAAVVGDLSIYPASGAVGTTVTISGSMGASHNTTAYSVRIGGQTVTPSSAITDTSGNFQSTFTVPPLAVGAQAVYAFIGADTTDTEYFTVTPKIAVVGTASGSVGSSFNLSGDGFAASSTVTILFDGTSIGTVSTSSSGSFPSTSFTVPEAERGSRLVSGKDASNNTSPTVSYSVTPTVTGSPSTGGVGDSITLSGQGFAGSSSIRVYFGSLEITGTTSDSNGSFSGLSFVVPSASRGSHTIRAQDAGGGSATTSYTVGQKMSISVSTGVPGTTVNVNGSGFNASQSITIKFNGVAITPTTSITSGTNGSFSGAFTVPSVAAGIYPVEASDGTYSYSTNFTIVATSNLSAATGVIGDNVTITGSGFSANSLLNVTYDTNQPLTTGTVKSDGTFSVTFAIPVMTGGAHTITASDGVNSQSVTFNMETVAPDAPAPVLPLDEGKVKELGVFEWTPVEDPSGVTYTFQIALDPSFVDTMIVLSKAGLTEPTYTLVEGEELLKVKKEEPYYWRVRAIDGASNAGEWSTAQWFTTGFVFEMPGWLTYLLFALGGLLLGVVGFWLGRRTAYY